MPFKSQILSALTLLWGGACALPQTEELPDSEQESTLMLFYTAQWSGEWTIANGLLSGQEELLMSGFQEDPNIEECYYVWQLEGIQTEEPECDTCLWEFDVTATLDGDRSILAEDCTRTNSEFKYAYTTDFIHEGENLGAALLLKEDGGLEPFVVPNNPQAPTTEETYTADIEWTSSLGSFAYTWGYIDHVYAYPLE